MGKPTWANFGSEKKTPVNEDHHPIKSDKNNENIQK